MSLSEKDWQAASGFLCPICGEECFRVIAGLCPMCSKVRFQRLLEELETKLLGMNVIPVKTGNNSLRASFGNYAFSFTFSLDYNLLSFQRESLSYGYPLNQVKNDIEAWALSQGLNFIDR